MSPHCSTRAVFTCGCRALRDGDRGHCMSALEELCWPASRLDTRRSTSASSTSRPSKEHAARRVHARVDSFNGRLHPKKLRISDSAPTLASLLVSASKSRPGFLFRCKNTVTELSALDFDPLRAPRLRTQPQHMGSSRYRVDRAAVFLASLYDLHMN